MIKNSIYIFFLAVICINNISAGQPDFLNVFDKPESLVLKIKILNQMPIGWGTKYKCKIITVEKGIMPEVENNLSDTGNGLIFSISAGSEKLYKYKYLQIDQVFVIKFIKTNIYNKEPYLQAGTNGFMDKQGMIWKIESIEKIK